MPSPREPRCTDSTSLRTETRPVTRWPATLGGSSASRSRQSRRGPRQGPGLLRSGHSDRKSTRLNSSHLVISYADFCLKKEIYIRIKYRSSGPAFDVSNAHVKPTVL